MPTSHHVPSDRPLRFIPGSRQCTEKDNDEKVKKIAKSEKWKAHRRRLRVGLSLSFNADMKFFLVFLCATDSQLRNESTSWWLHSTAKFSARVARSLMKCATNQGDREWGVHEPANISNYLERVGKWFIVVGTGKWPRVFCGSGCAILIRSCME